MLAAVSRAAADQHRKGRPRQWDLVSKERAEQGTRKLSMLAASLQPAPMQTSQVAQV